MLSDTLAALTSPFGRGQIARWPYGNPISPLLKIALLRIAVGASSRTEKPDNTMQNTERQLPGIDVLNTGYGDFELRFDPDKPDEVQKAKETITDMLKRGYAIFIRQGKETSRVRKFDVNRNVYIIGSTPAEEVPIAEAKATAVGRSAGG